nr:TDT family transporter [uncultured Cohaesibacter sp.]
MTEHLNRLFTLPTPTAGLALGIASLGLCWENSGLFAGQAQMAGALVGAMLLLLLLTGFILRPGQLLNDVKHPVVGSIVPTFSMATMLVASAVGGSLGLILWLMAVAMHVLLLLLFCIYRLRGFHLHQMVPSWYIPPVGIIVANITLPDSAFSGLASILFWFGLVCYAVMQPVMIYRFLFEREVPDAAKPTFAIMAAPASLSLAGYLAIAPAPSMLLVMILLGVALLMTAVIYLALFRLMRLPFTPGYSAFTFPLVISATALFKGAAFLAQWQETASAAAQLLWLARLELAVATVVVVYVAIRYALWFATVPATPAPSKE